ncbi:hypothetical protein ACO0QE_003779 [Hanseniaspora vineae]
MSSSATESPDLADNDLEKQSSEKDVSLNSENGNTSHGNKKELLEDLPGDLPDSMSEDDLARHRASTSLRHIPTVNTNTEGARLSPLPTRSEEHLEELEQVHTQQSSVLFGITISAQLKGFIKLHLSLITLVILGNWARMGINQLSASYSPSYVTSGSIIWTNFTACFIMGFLQTIHAGPFQAPLTTGFCGTFSSFSTFIWELFNHSTSTSQYRNNAYGIMEFLSVLILELSVSMGATIFGIEFGAFFVNLNEHNEKVENFLLRYVFKLSYYLAIPLTIVMVVLASVYSNFSRLWTLSSIFAIFGSLARYYFCTYLNPVYVNFPLGTFISNILSCIILSALKMVTLSKNSNLLDHHGENSTRVMDALGDGLCAGLSTMSTFMVEGKKLPLDRALIYFTVSIGLSYCIFIVMVGSYKWTVGLTS